MELIADMNDQPPRCIECGYILRGLTELRCPECGTGFDSEYIKEDSYRVHLLPWERPEIGGWIKRLFRTFMLASLHPKQFYDSVNHRKDIRIRKPIKLILAYILASFCMLYAAQFVGEMIGFVLMWAKLGQFSQAWDIKQRVFRLTWLTTMASPFVLVLPLMLPVGVMATLISRFFREKIGSLRYVDIAGLYSSTFVLQAFFMSCLLIAISIFTDMSFVIYGLIELVIPIIVLQPIWFVSRRLLMLGRRKSIGMLVVCLVVFFVCIMAGSLLAQIPFLISHGLL